MRFRLAAFADEASSSLGGQIEAMKKNGIPYLEIRGVDGESIADITPDKAKEIRRRLDGEGISVWSIGSPFGKIGIDEDFAPHLDIFRRTLDVAGILGAGHFRLFSFYGEKRFDDVLERLNSFISAARGTGIVLCHENEKDIYGDTAQRYLEIHRALPELKAIFDPANFIQCGQDTKEAWELLETYVEYMHLKDATPDGNVVPSGKGAGNIEYLLGQYKGDVLTVEPHLAVFDGLQALEKEHVTMPDAYSYSDAMTAFSAAVDSLREIIGRLG